ncbi:MAG TPA: hypothetical protein VFB77_19085 [Acidimicrobiales bacterium]|nr:hypothetical protein [Acidimicrobiales bacterium]
MSRDRAAAVIVALALAACGSGGGGGDRQAEIAARGADVMPFDLDATTHRFTPLATGLEQVVVADDPADGAQVALVRGHLRDEAGRFARGDYGDPAAIHGDHMPGLAALEAGHDAVEIAYADVPAGARITYTTADAALVEALHAWGAAQVRDHGAQAEAGRPAS